MSREEDGRKEEREGKGEEVSREEDGRKEETKGRRV